MGSMDYLNETLEMLEDLTEEELAELNDIFDPENNLLPISERMHYECSKQPTRIFNRAQLSKHLEETANESTVGKDYLPFEKKNIDYSNHMLKLPGLKSVAKARAASPLPDLTQDEMENIDNATEDELVEVAAMLKMNELVTAEQMESIRQGQKPTAGGILRPSLVKTQYPIQKSFSIDEDDDIEETVDVDAMVKALRSKGQDISIIICNNQPYMDPEVLEEIAAHLLANKNIRHLSLANCNVSDSVIDSLAEALENNTKLETLNLESNFITPVGIKKLMDSIEESKSLREIRLENQYGKVGPKAESQMSACVEKNFTLLNFGYSFETRGPRDQVNRYILRNNDMLRAARKNGTAWYNLAEQKRIIAKYRPPWIIRRPKRRGPEADMLEGRKIIMKGSSKKKKKKGPALVNEMLAKAAQVSKKWADKEKTGELKSEYARIEDQSKMNLPDEPKKKNSEERRRRRKKGSEDSDEDEDEDEDSEGKQRRRSRDAPGDAAGMGAAGRRRGRRSAEDDEDDDDVSERRDSNDSVDGNAGRSKLGEEARRKAMRGGKVIDEESVGLGNMSLRGRKNREALDDDDDAKKEEQSEDEDDEGQGSGVKGQQPPSGPKQKIPAGKPIGSQPVAGLDSLSMRGRRKKVVDDEEEDLDAMLKSVSADSGASSSKAAKEKDKGSEGSIRRRKKNQEDEAEDLDDILSSVTRKEDTEAEQTEESNDNDNNSDRGKVKVPSGKAIGSQAIAQLESVSLRGRRKNRPEDEEESLDSLLNSVKREEEEEEKEEADEPPKPKNTERRESVSKLPTGRKVGSQKIAELESLSMRQRRRKVAYEDEEEDIDSILEAVTSENSKEEKGSGTESKGDKEARIPGKGKLASQAVTGLDNASRRSRRKVGDEEEEDLDSILASAEVKKTDEKDAGDDTDNDNDGEREKEEERKKKLKIPSGKPVAKEQVKGMDTLSFAERRRRKRLGLDDDEEEKPVAEAVEEKAEDKRSARSEVNTSEVKKSEDDSMKIPRGDRLAKSETSGMEAMTRRSRRKAADDDGDDETVAAKEKDASSSRRGSGRLRRQDAAGESLTNGLEEKAKAPVVTKAPEPKPEPVVIKAPEKPAFDPSKPMSLRERRRLREQGLL